MNLGTQNPHHRRGALLQLALCAVTAPALIFLGLGFTSSDAVPGVLLDSAPFETGVLLVLAMSVLLLAFQAWAAWRYLQQAAGARHGFVLSSVLCLASFPVGTAVGVYCLWVVLSVPLQPERRLGMDDGGA